MARLERVNESSNWNTHANRKRGALGRQIEGITDSEPPHSSGLWTDSLENDFDGVHNRLDVFDVGVVSHMPDSKDIVG